MSRWLSQLSWPHERQLVHVPLIASSLAGVTYSFTGAFGTITTPTRVHILRCSDAAREDRPFLRPSARSDLEICRESVWFRQARRPYKQ